MKFIRKYGAGYLVGQGISMGCIGGFMQFRPFQLIGGTLCCIGIAWLVFEIHQLNKKFN